MAQMQKALRRAARSAAGTTKINKLSDFNPVVPKGMEIVSVTVMNVNTMVTNFANKKP
jgi:hypothetical protein